LLNDGIIAGEQPTPGAPWRIRLTKDWNSAWKSDPAVGVISVE
jgi:hypothetical protein